MGRTFASDREWRFGLAPDRLWDRLTAVDEYARWWPWLRELDVDRGFVTASRWRCEVAPPLPYVVRFTVALERVVDREQVTATVDGDVQGTARLTMQPDDDGTTTVRLVSDLVPANPVMRRFAAFAPALVRWGHDWVLDQGRRQFEQRALADDRR